MPDKTISAASLRQELIGFLSLRSQDPHANPAKLLAFRLSEKIANGSVSLDQLEDVLCDLCKSSAQARGARLAIRAGLPEIDSWRRQFKKMIRQQASLGFGAFRKWAQSEAIGLVATAHPTFALTQEMRAQMLQSASGKSSRKKLSAKDIIRDQPPSLQGEHGQAQACIDVMHRVIDETNGMIFAQAAKSFPNDYTKLTPRLVSVASWVGYDLDGRRDIEWTDTFRLKLSEKAAKLAQYHAMAATLAQSLSVAGKPIPAGLTGFLKSAEKAGAAAKLEQQAFEKDMSDKDNLVAAANLLTRDNRDRWLDTKTALGHLNTAIQQATSRQLKQDLLVLRAHISRGGMGTAALHLRVNAQQVLHAMDAHLPIMPDERLSSRTFLRRVSQYAEKVKPVRTNFADLDAEDGTVNRQLILAAQIVKHIDCSMPIRFLIAECDQASIVLSALALARYFGVAEQLDISPLFETPNALRNGGRVVAQMLEQPAYREHVKKRGVIAVQTGFSDAGRFMGQIAAVLAIERLQSHLAAAIAESKLTDLRAIVFNTHGESAGRGGHPGSLKARMDYIMSPWVLGRFQHHNIALTHEFSFQGGDGYLWFANPQIGEAALLQLLCARFQPTQSAQDDEFYDDADFVWDFYNEVITQQDSLYHDDDYRFILSGFARNFLIPSGSRPEIRQASGPLQQSTFTPRRIRAIPHNAILQQLSLPTNVIYGVGRAGRIDPARFHMIFAKSGRGRTVLDMVLGSWGNTHLPVLAAYGDFQDPNFWISRSISQGNNPVRRQYRVVAQQLYKRNANAKLRQFLYRLRADGDLLAGVLQDEQDQIQLSLAADADIASQNQILFHCIRLALLMHAQFTCASLPVNAPPGASRDEIMEKICNYDLEQVIETLQTNYPAHESSESWSQGLAESGRKEDPHQTGSQQVLASLTHCRRLLQLTSQGLVQAYNAYG
ncbi:phosphoenolpyruvate carboxylase [Alphaproteobacteria bacterium]|nr:phosphoenolpyruvate carboxylase [Alphaproteobacteria bacterium]